MPDLETALRIKLGEMCDASREHSHEYEAHDHVRGEIINWLSMRGDGWHDLRENPEDVPKDCRGTWVITIAVGLEFDPIVEKLHLLRGKWRGDYGGELEEGDMVIAWKYCEEKPIVPVRFQKEKV